MLATLHMVAHIRHARLSCCLPRFRWWQSSSRHFCFNSHFTRQLTSHLIHGWLRSRVWSQVLTRSRKTSCCCCSCSATPLKWVLQAAAACTRMCVYVCITTAKSNRNISPAPRDHQSRHHQRRPRDHKSNSLGYTPLTAANAVATRVKHCIVQQPTPGYYTMHNKINVPGSRVMRCGRQWWANCL